MKGPALLPQARNAFCAIRPPGHHAGPVGVVTCKRDPHGSHGFCLLNNIAIAGAYAVNRYRHDGAAPRRTCAGFGVWGASGFRVHLPLRPGPGRWARGAAWVEACSLPQSRSPDVGF